MNALADEVRRCLRILLSPCLLLLAATVCTPRAFADEGLAPSVAAALAKAKVKSVVVFDFIGPGNSLNQLGVEIADTLSDSLVNSGTKLKVIDRSEVRAIFKKNCVAPTVVRDPELAGWLAHQLGAESVISGRITSKDAGTIQLAVSADIVHPGKSIDRFSSAEIPLTEAMKDHLEKIQSVDASTIKPILPGGSIVLPHCIHCPRPNFSFSAEVLEHKTTATVVLVGVVTLDGTVRDIDFVRAEPAGLTQKAIEAVRAWKLEPAKDANGKPIEVHQIIDLQVHFYN